MAEAQVEVERARAARSHAEGGILAARAELAAKEAPLPPVPAAVEEAVEQTSAALREFNAKRSPWRAAIRLQRDLLGEHVRQQAERRGRIANLFAQLARIDRYERRALSRRAAAMRDLDALRPSPLPSTS